MTGLLTGTSAGGDYTTEFDMVVQIEVLGLTDEEIERCGETAEITEVDLEGVETKAQAAIEIDR